MECLQTTEKPFACIAFLFFQGLWEMSHKNINSSLFLLMKMAFAVGFPEVKSVTAVVRLEFRISFICNAEVGACNRKESGWGLRSGLLLLLYIQLVMWSLSHTSIGLWKPSTAVISHRYYGFLPGQPLSQCAVCMALGCDWGTTQPLLAAFPILLSQLEVCVGDGWVRPGNETPEPRGISATLHSLRSPLHHKGTLLLPALPETCQVSQWSPARKRLLHLSTMAESPKAVHCKLLPPVWIQRQKCKRAHTI